MGKASGFSEEISIPCKAGHTLRGSLLLPVQERVPVVIVVHGANAQLRSDYRHYADAFAQKGMGAFIYDKRGWGRSTGGKGWADIYALADDLVEVIEHVRQHPTVSSLGLCGFSNGCWVAPLAATRVEGAVKFIIACSGSGVTPADQECYRRGMVAAHELGATPEQAALIREFWEHAMQFVGTGEWTPAFEQVLERINTDAGIQALPKHEGMPEDLQPVPPVLNREEWEKMGGDSSFMLFDVVPVFADLTTIPVLSVWGEQDTVVPVQESITAMREGMANHPDYTYFVVPDVEHSLTIAGKETQFPTEMRDRITEWAWQKARAVDL